MRRSLAAALSIVLVPVALAACFADASSELVFECCDVLPEEIEAAGTVTIIDEGCGPGKDR